MKTKTAFINDFFRFAPINLGIFILTISWILIIVEPNVIVMTLTIIGTCGWFVALIYLIWTGRLTRITVYADRITWNRHFRTQTIYIDDIKIEKIIPVKNHQWCTIIINDDGKKLYMGLCNSRHMARMLKVLQPSKFTDVIKEEKKKCEEWRFNSSW